MKRLIQEDFSQAAFVVAECQIPQNEDWVDDLPILYDGDRPSDLTGKRVELYIRPVYDHAVLIKFLSTDNGGLIIDDAKEGMVSVYVPQAAVAAMPLGTWDHFVIEVESDPVSGIERRTERFRGPLTIHPGRLA